jgi:hypothetical protein
MKNKIMKCMACGMPTLFTMKRKEIEAAFCPMHMPNQRLVIEIIISR